MLADNKMKLANYFFLAVLGLTCRCSALRLPKLFKNGMVLQADPTTAIIWGFLDGNSDDPVDVASSCHFRGKKFGFKNQFVPQQVNEIVQLKTIVVMNYV